ncbi:response regulator transcription factor [Caulobacter segnis]|uniref:response regulator transcription factor n=1 Tax=Caulobacter segnis TaxID=88688 RepID=UPI00240FAD12|nr:response regulator transcription factor [Caulobacter segnis]MDG2523045.1 response regulator transcription factor [Caulobacter segnis]
MRLLIVEDHDELAELIIGRLEQAGFPSDHVASAEDARLLIDGGDYAGLLLDLGLPDGDGIDLLEWLRGRNKTLPVLILTARSALRDRIAGLDAGADDYLGKPFATDELIARVRALMRRATAGGAATLTCGRLTYDAAARLAQVGDAPLSLSRREAQLLELLLRHRDKVVRKTQIETLFFGFGEEFSSNAVEVGVHRLRKRLDQLEAGVEVVTMRGVGYLLREQAA